MDKNVEAIMKVKINNTARSLLNHGFDVYVVENKAEAIAQIQELIPAKATVNLGGSQTLFETGIIAELHNMDIELQDRYAEGADIPQVFRQAFSADIYLTGTNAITEDGMLYNIDSNGNRVAAMTFGPKEVIVVVGQNKIVKDMDAAVKRLRDYAAPMNCERLQRDTPCRKVGSCVDCNTAETICSTYVVQRRSPTPKRIKIILIKEELGY